MSTRWTEKHSAVLAVLEFYDPIRQVLLELSDLPEEPTESRRKATSLYSVLTSRKFCIKLCILEHVMSILSQWRIFLPAKRNINFIDFRCPFFSVYFEAFYL